MSKSAWIAVIATACLVAGCGGGNAPEEAATLGTASAPAPSLELTDLPAPYNEASLSEGAMQFAKCRNCHTVVEGQAHRVGPNLHGLFDREPGSAEGFRYSEAMTTYAESVWTPEAIDHWLQKPAEFLPGSSMFFNGIDDPTARRDLIAWLMIEASR